MITAISVCPSVGFSLELINFGGQLKERFPFLPALTEMHEDRKFQSYLLNLDWNIIDDLIRRNYDK